ncbi:MAG: hypothetical protein MZV63_25305 [Marinilabiliales bacterium]|nr:hypothetical protein [Marinilabiliales bacterium]
MEKKLIQRIIFITCAIAALLNPMLEDVIFLRYVLLAGSMFYLLLGWYFPLLDENKSTLKNELVGFAYSTVFFANFMESAQMPLGTYLVYFGDLLYYYS